MKRGNRLYVFKSHKEQPDEEITHDFVMDHCVFAGTVNKVVDQILALREETGDFGELVYAGMDWVDPALAKRSMQLMAEQVMPRVNAAIGQAGERRGGVRVFRQLAALGAQGGRLNEALFDLCQRIAGTAPARGVFEQNSALEQDRRCRVTPCPASICRAAPISTR